MNLCSLNFNKTENRQIKLNFRKSWNSGVLPNIYINNKCRANAEIVLQIGNLDHNRSTMSLNTKNVYIKNSCGGNAEIFIGIKNNKRRFNSISKNSFKSETGDKNAEDLRVEVNNSCRGNAKIIIQLEGCFETSQLGLINSSCVPNARLRKMNNKHRRNGSSKKIKNKKVNDVSNDPKVSGHDEPATRSKEDAKIIEVCCVCLMHQTRDDLKICKNFHSICKLCYSERPSPKECLICKMAMDEDEGLSGEGESHVAKNIHLKHYCPVCRNLIRSKARFCSNLHLVCNRCFLQMIQSDECPDVCPTCRGDYPKHNLCNLLEEALKGRFYTKCNK